MSFIGKTTNTFFSEELQGLSFTEPLALDINSEPYQHYSTSTQKTLALIKRSPCSQKSLSGDLNSSRQNLLSHPIPTPPSSSFNLRWQARKHLQQLVGRIGRLQHLPRSPILIGKIRVHSTRV